MYSSIASLALALSLLSAGVEAQVCESHGVDFQNGGSYFQNISSADPFTFVSTYNDCEADFATNILVDPNSDEYLCSDTPLQPDDVEELSTCPLLKNQMFSGLWSVLILSNNGGGDPVAYMRDFNLVVGSPVTMTFTPTIPVTVTSTPLSTITTTTTTTITNTVTSSTVLPAKTKTPTTTITPPAVTTTKTFGPTVKLTATVFAPIITTKTVTKTCKVSTQTHNDPKLTYRPTLLPKALSSLAAKLDLTAPPSYRDEDSLGRRVPIDSAQRIAERRERVANIEKRAPDSSTTTIIDTNTANWPTSTSTALAPTSTITITTVLTTTQVTTSVTTIYSGNTTLPTKYITLPTKTITKLKPTIFFTTVATVTKKPLFTITIPKNDPAATKACIRKGGVMVDPAKCTNILGLFC